MAKYVQPIFNVHGVAEFLNQITLDSSVFIKSHVDAAGETPYALVTDNNTGTESVKKLHLGTMATKQSADYDASIANINSSIGALDTLTQGHTADIAQLDASIVRIDASLNDVIDVLSLGFVTETSLGTFKTSYIDPSLNAKLNKAGDTMTGLLTLAAAGITLGGQNIVGIDTSGNITELETHIPTSAAVKSLVDSAISAGVTASNGLTENPAGNIKLGGTLSEPTTIDISTHSLTLSNLVSGITRLAVISDGGVLKTQQLGTMALETSTNYYGKTQVDLIVSDLSTLLDTRLDFIDTSLGTLNGLINTNITNISNIETSLGILNTWNVNQDISIAGAYASASGVKGWNGLTRTDNSIGLGGTLNTGATTITTSLGTASLRITGLATSTENTPLALVTDTAGADLKIRALGSMAWETSTNYYGKTQVDGIVSDLSTLLDTRLDFIDTSLGILNDWNVSQDASIVTLRNTTLSALQTANNGLTAGDTSVALGGALSHNTDIDTGAYYLSVTGDMRVVGDLTVDGSVTYINSVNLNVSDNIITLNYGETGHGVTKTYAGIAIDRGSSTNYFFGFSELTETFRIGIQNETLLPENTQAVATREDTPTAFGVPFWNATEFRFDTSAGLIFTPGVGLSLPIATDQSSETTALVISGAGLVGTRELGSNAFNSSTYVLQSLFDTSVAAVWTKLGHVDTSLNNIWTKFGYVDSSIAGLDTLTQSHTQSITDLSTNKISGVANINVTGDASIYSYTNANHIAQLKKIVAGTGATITEDVSTITIAVSGTAGYVKKHVGTFNGTTGTSYSIPEATHNLGTGPFTVSVFENNAEVYTGVDFNGSGDITLSWSPGSLTDASCKFIITG